MAEITAEKLKWTEEQQKVIQAPAESKILVNAGPGTGKTATACGRVAWLIDHAGISPSEIWIVSFTRTAVRELKNRIACALSNPEQASGIRIATIDAHAWAIHSGFTQGASLAGSYDSNIRHVTEMIRSHEGVFEYIEGVRHLFVDEAQDITGPRIELLLELIQALPNASGVSVFFDPAQGIYGFTEESDSDDLDGTLPEKIQEYMSDGFQVMELTEIHRTNDKSLRILFGSGREILSQNETPKEKIRESILLNRHATLEHPRDYLEKSGTHLSEDTFVLCRKRGDALTAASYYQFSPYRLRMSGLPPAIFPWVALIFHDCLSDDMSADCFLKLWEERIAGDNESGSSDEIWNTLVGIAGVSDFRISIPTLAKRLSTLAPPPELCMPEYGLGGPVFGTIHGNKGREANDVCLYIPKHSGEQNELEEARILFVGASRPKKRLAAGEWPSKAVAHTLDESGRAYTPYPFQYGKKHARAAVEIGRTGDITATLLAGTGLFDSPEDVREAQKSIMTGKKGFARLIKAGDEWYYHITLDSSSRRVAFLSPSVGRDLFAIAKHVDRIVKLKKYKPPLELPYIRSLGQRTIAVSPDSAERNTLHSPWNRSGFLLAPMISGYGLVWFR